MNEKGIATFMFATEWFGQVELFGYTALVQSNLDYQDLLGLMIKVRIIENMNINNSAQSTEFGTKLKSPDNWKVQIIEVWIIEVLQYFYFLMKLFKVRNM